MARPLRVEFPGALYHVVNRGNRRERVFRINNRYQAVKKALAPPKATP